MKKRIPVLAVLFLGLSLQFSLAQDNKELSSAIWDFGKVKAGDVLKHAFHFVNETDKVVNIKSVGTSCGCTASEAKKKVLEPKESTTIEVSFNSKGYNGSVEQYVYVNTDDGKSPIQKFIIKAEVLKQ